MKPGYKTTEFYMALLAALLPVLKQYILPGLDTEALYGGIAAAVAYILSRTAAKWRS